MQGEHKHYKENYAIEFMNKRGQLAIIVILAIVIVGVVLVVFLLPGVNVFVSDVEPSSFLRECVKDDVLEMKEVLSKQGGYLTPSNYLTYEDEQIQYLCYTDESFKPCIVQQPLLVEHIRGEIENFVEPRARSCLSNLEEEYESRGFSVQSEGGEIEVNMVSGSINVDFLANMVVSREETTQRFDKFSVGIESEWYDLLLTAVSIIQFESTLGDSETLTYIQYYPDLSIEKIERDGGDTIYRLRNVVTNDEFTFASRSLVWPPGYGLEEL